MNCLWRPCCLTRWNLVFALLLLTSACSLRNLDNDISRAYEEYGLIKVTPYLEEDTDTTVLIGLYSTLGERSQLLNVRSVISGDPAIFLLPQGEYRAVAFADLNDDFIYQAGEPIAQTKHMEVNTAPAAGDRSTTNIDEHELILMAQAALEYSADLSLGSLESKLHDYDNQFLKLTTWQDKNFSSKAVKLGMWQPLTFLEEIGFGLYITQPLDTSRDLVVYVHGINGSPSQFKELSAALGDIYQTLLFQYPSGASLEYSSYMLRAGLNELAARYPANRIHVIAHSMGGLVSRGAIVYASDKTAAKIHSFVSMSTPWAGHEGARAGVKWSPTVAPVWRSMVPHSDYQQAIFSRPLPQNIDHLLLFSFAHKLGGEGSASDGVVTVSSQLYYPAQDESVSTRGVADDHNGILENTKTFGWIAQHLASKHTECVTARLTQAK